MNKLDLMLEAEKRGILPEGKKAVLDEARKRGLIPQQKTLQNAPQVPFYVSDDSGQEVNLNAPEYADEKKRLDKEDTARRDEKKTRLENRGYTERALDAAAFAGSVIPRTLTKGEYGLGDIAKGVGMGRVGEEVEAGERGFVEANEDVLRTVADIGEASLGVPGFSQLGAPLRSVGAAAKTIAASPRGTVAGGIRGTGQALQGISREPGAVAGAGSALALPTAANRVGRAIEGYADGIQPKAAPPPKAPTPPSQLPPPQNIQSLPDRLRDLQAFRDEEIKPFGPAMASKGTARTARTIEELPLVGGTVKSPKTDVGLAVEDRLADTARQLGAPGSDEGIGLTVQSGLKRFRTSNLEDLPPGEVRALGINPSRPAASSRGTLKIDRPSQFSTANLTAAQQKLAEQGRITLPSSNRSRIEDLTPVELDRIIEAPARVTSFATKVDALYTRAHSRLPALFRKNGSANPNEIATRHSKNIIQGITREEESALINGGIVDGRFGGLSEALGNLYRNFTIDSLRAARTQVGRALGSFGEYDTRLDRTQLKQIYSGLTRDLESGYVALAARARRDSKLSPSNKSYVPPSQADAADRALREFRTADRYMRSSMARIDRFMSVLDAPTLEDAGRKIGRYVREKTQDVRALQTLKASLRPEEWNAVVGHVIESLGKGRAGAKEAEAGFNWSHWATDWNKIGPSGKRILTDGLPEGVANRLDNIARIVERMKYYETTRNFSGSAYSAAGLGLLMSPDMMLGAASMLGMGGIAGKLLTSNAYLAWLEATMRTQMRIGNTLKGNLQITGQTAQQLGQGAKQMAQSTKQLKAIAARQKDPQLARQMQAFALMIEDATKEKRGSMAP